MVASEENPLISVIMGIYNCADTLTDALESIVAQSYTNWEIILCDDSSTDRTLEIAEAFVNRFPNNVKLLKNEQNMGLNFTLNRCLQCAKGDLVARMDGDDICSKERFEREIAALRGHPEYAIVSTDMVFFDEEGVWGKTRVKEFPQATDFVRHTPFCHAACMVRREAYNAVGGYSVDRKLLRVEDYHLWIKMYEKGFYGFNITEPLYSMRDDRNAQSRKKYRFRFNEAYVKAYAVKHLQLPKHYYIYCVVPLLIGLLPRCIYQKLHRRKRAKEPVS